MTGATLTAGSGGTLANTINITGIGGTGTATPTHGLTGGNNGVELEGALAFNLNGTSAGNSINFINCIGGTSGGGFNYGVNFATSVTFFGPSTFQNITGGGIAGSIGNYAVIIQNGVTVSAARIAMTDVVGGAGLGTNTYDVLLDGSYWTGNVGLYINGTGILGGANTNAIAITAGSLGVGSGEIGVMLDDAAQMVGTNITLVGTGGGLYSSSTSGHNYGVYFRGGKLTGTTINVTGLGGSGTAGFNNGTSVDTNGFSVIAPAMTFLNCIGGAGTNSYGVSITSSMSVANGALFFNSAVGGSISVGNYGVFISGAGTQVGAATISGVDMLGGPGTNTNYGFYLTSGAILGGTGTGRITLSGGSLGSGSTNVGIQMDGGAQMQVGDGGTIH